MFQAPRSLVSICQREPCKVHWKIRQADLSGLRGFRHPKLQEMHKRPTRSKSYRGTAAVSVTEHQSFQIALTWLWQRTNGKQPKLVEAALQDCPTCKESFWSGDGTSATESICNEKATATHKVAKERQHGTPCGPAVADPDENKHHASASTRWGFLYWGTFFLSSVIEMHLPISGGAQTAKGFSSSVIGVSARAAAHKLFSSGNLDLATANPAPKFTAS